MVWILDGYTTLDNYPYSELTSLSSATADSNEVALNRLAPDKKVSYIRNSVKATVDAYDGTVTLYAQDEQDPVLKAWMSVFPGTVKPKSDISPDLAQHLRYPEDLFKVQRMLLAKYHVNDPVTFFSTSDFWDVPQDPNPSASSYQPPYYIVARDLAANDKSASFQLTTAMNRFRRDFLAAYISASSDPDTYGKITVLTFPARSTGRRLGEQRDQYRHRGVDVSRPDRSGQPEPNSVRQPADPADRRWRAALRGTRVCLPGQGRRRVDVSTSDSGRDVVQGQDRVRADGGGSVEQPVRGGRRIDGDQSRAG